MLIGAPTSFCRCSVSSSWRSWSSFVSPSNVAWAQSPWGRFRAGLLPWAASMILDSMARLRRNEVVQPPVKTKAVTAAAISNARWAELVF